MLGRIIKCDRTVEMRSPFCKGARMQHGPHHAMPDHERNRRHLLLGQRQKLARQLAQRVAVERNEARGPEAENFNFIRDIAPVAGVIRGSLVMVVNPSVPAKSVPEFIAYAKANPGKLTMASAGTGANSHLSGELFKMMAGVALGPLPYRGQRPA